MPNQSISYLIGFLITSISFLNFEVNAGINKKDFKSKTVSELIDVLNIFLMVLAMKCRYFV